MEGVRQLDVAERLWVVPPMFADLLVHLLGEQVVLAPIADDRLEDGSGLVQPTRQCEALDEPERTDHERVLSTEETSADVYR